MEKEKKAAKEHGKEEKKKAEPKAAEKAKVEEKKEHKAGHTGEHKTVHKEEHAKKPVEKKEEAPKIKKKKKIIEKWSKPQKAKEIKKLSELIKKRPRRLFRGRFGQRNMTRNIRDEKWQKWRVTTGIDISHKKDDGLVVKVGYRSPLKIRGLHPSGYKEILVHNMHELENSAKEKQAAIKISGTIGMRKRHEMLKKANQLKLWVLNP